MKRPAKLLAALSVLLYCRLTCAQEPATNVQRQDSAATLAQDTADVQHVMDAFHAAVLSHDGARLASLFVPEGGAWFNVLSDEAYARVKLQTPGAQKVRRGSYQDFVEFVASSKADPTPVHSNVQVHSDGTVASVYFDFVFLIDGKEQNRGSETWQLVKGEGGWRIVALTYSANPGGQ